MSTFWKSKGCSLLKNRYQRPDLTSFFASRLSELACRFYLALHSAVCQEFSQNPPLFIYSLVAALLIKKLIGNNVSCSQRPRLWAWCRWVGPAVHFYHSHQSLASNELEAMISRLDFPPSFHCDLESTHWIWPILYLISTERLALLPGCLGGGVYALGVMGLSWSRAFTGRSWDG